MKNITQENIKVYSSAFHGALSGVVVLGLLVLVSYGYSRNLILWWFASVFFACYFGWVLGSWYVPIKLEPWFFEPYIVSPIVSLLSALSTGLVFAFYTELSASVQNMFNLGSVMGGGIFLGVYAFILTLPVTVIMGVAVPLCL